MYGRSVGGSIYFVRVCVLVSFRGRGGASDCGKSRLPLRCHRQRDIPRRCRNQQRGGQNGHLPSECPETTLAWIRRYDPGQATAHPYACPRPIPTFSVRSPSGGSSPVELVLSREVCPYISLLSSRLCVSPLLLSFHLVEKCPPPPSSPLFSRPRAPLSPPSFPNRHAFASNTADPTVPLLLSEIAASLCALSASTRIVLPFAP